jgi:hypothetical protein
MLRKPQSAPPYRSRAITQPKLSPSQEFCPAKQTDVDLQKKKCIPAEKDMKKSGLAVHTSPIPPRQRLISQPHDWFQAFPFQQFHALFNSLFKVLFIFPSRYLFAIGLSPIFSFRWNLPPILSCIPKQLDSLKTYHIVAYSQSKTGFSPSMIPYSKGFIPRLPPKTLL